jgi:Cdc6-like AAA superfamily ATPase
MSDDYGIEREKINAKAGIREIFTPNKPINALDLFFGRKDIVKRVIESLNTPGQHLLLYGDRGVGKSSLANITAKILNMNDDFIKGKLLIKRCSSSDSFLTVSQSLVQEYCPNEMPREEVVTKTDKEGVGVNVVGIGAKRDYENSSSKKYCHEEIKSPSDLANHLKNKTGLFLIDEFDTLALDEDKKKIAELIKLLSDYNSPFKIFIVGIAQSGTDLTAGHPSVNRCLKEIKLERMDDAEIKQILINGMKKLSIDVSEQVGKLVVDISNGYPHFAQLIGLKCAEEAVIKKISKITKSTLIIGLDKAVNDAEGTMKRLYDNATQKSSSSKSKHIELILKACSASVYDDFRLCDISERLKEYRNELPNNTISRYMREFTDSNGESILRRIKKGVYRFNDPRMQSYIKMRENILERNPLNLPYGQI